VGGKGGGFQFALKTASKFNSVWGTLRFQTIWLLYLLVSADIKSGTSVDKFRKELPLQSFLLFDLSILFKAFPSFIAIGMSIGRIVAVLVFVLVCCESGETNCRCLNIMRLG
jgi:hypothetical protein